MSVSIAYSFKNKILDVMYNKNVTAVLYDAGGISIPQVTNLTFPTKAQSGVIQFQQVDFAIPTGHDLIKVNKVSLFYQKPGVTGGVKWCDIILEESEQAEYGPEGGLFRIGELKISI